MPHRSRWLAPERLIVLASAMLYLASLPLPAIAETHPDGVRIDEAGYLLLAMGWAGLLAGQIGWFANLLWIVAAIVLWMRRWTSAVKLAVGAL